jgi:hypothetical protein
MASDDSPQSGSGKDAKLNRRDALKRTATAMIVAGAAALTTRCSDDDPSGPTEPKYPSCYSSLYTSLAYASLVYSCGPGYNSYSSYSSRYSSYSSHYSSYAYSSYGYSSYGGYTSYYTVSYWHPN